MKWSARRRLYHYSAEAFVLDPHRTYVQERVESLPMKPNGLWLSVESDDEESFGWRDWCERENFGLPRLTHRTEVVLRPGANVLHLDEPGALIAFTRLYQRVVHGISFCAPIDWVAVARDYSGLVIAPYQWTLRLDLHWYYGWDCASGCIWDCTALDQPRGDNYGPP